MFINVSISKDNEAAITVLRKVGALEFFKDYDDPRDDSEDKLNELSFDLLTARPIFRVMVPTLLMEFGGYISADLGVYVRKPLEAKDVTFLVGLFDFLDSSEE